VRYPVSRKSFKSAPAPGAALARAPWGVALLGAALGILLAVLVFAPAAWLSQGVAQISDGRVRLAQTSGTVWSGSGQLQLNGGAQSRDASALPGRVHWQLLPDWGGLGLSLQADCCTKAPLRAHLSPRWAGAKVTLSDSMSQWPAAVLSGLGTPWNTVLLEGRLTLSTQSLSVEWVEGRLSVQGRAQLDALDAASRLSTLKPLGSYRLVLNSGATPDPAAPSNTTMPATLQLETLSGSLQLTGSGQWVGGRLRFNGEASATPGREAALTNLLNILGRRQGARSIITIG
jgi:general secretion pathway protein N